MKKKYAGVIAASILASGYAPDVSAEPIAARNIRAGAVIAAADIETPPGPDALRRAAELVGLEAVRTINRGQPISMRDLRPQTVVERNAVVTMEFKRGPLTITTEGRAMAEGGVGQRILVMNLLSKRTVSAVIVGANSVRTLQ